eukprot:COSAG01_NODE_34586_length_545_cov_0.825112_2_plen_83_part_01
MVWLTDRARWEQEEERANARALRAKELELPFWKRPGHMQFPPAAEADVVAQEAIAKKRPPRTTRTPRFLALLALISFLQSCSS